MDAYFFASDYCKMYKTGGWRERDVLDHPRDRKHTATWDIIMSRWAN